MFKLTTTAISDNLLKALIYDVLTTVVVNYINSVHLRTEELFEVLSAAFTAFTIRGIAREDFNHPWIGGFIGGMVKYTAKNTSTIAGGFNNFAYEFLIDMPSQLEGMEAGLIEGVEGAGLKIYDIITGNSDLDEDKPWFEPILKDFVIAGGIGLMVTAFDHAFYSPLSKYISNYQLPDIPLLSVSYILISHALSSAYHNGVSTLYDSSHDHHNANVSVIIDDNAGNIIEIFD